MNVSSSISINGGVAQLGEHLPCKQGVKGSNPSISTVDSQESTHLYLENRITKNLKVSKFANKRDRQDIRGEELERVFRIKKDLKPK